MAGDVTFSSGAIQLITAAVIPIVSALVGMFWLLHRSQNEALTRAQKQNDTLLPALEKLTDLVERLQRAA